VLDVREYLAADGSSPYAKWFKNLNAPGPRLKWQWPLLEWHKVTFLIQRALEAGFKNTASTSDPVIESTLAGMVNVW